MLILVSTIIVVACGYRYRLCFVRMSCLLGVLQRHIVECHYIWPALLNNDYRHLQRFQSSCNKKNRNAIKGSKFTQKKENNLKIYIKKILDRPGMCL